MKNLSSHTKLTEVLFRQKGAVQSVKPALSDLILAVTVPGTVTGDIFVNPPIFRLLNLKTPNLLFYRR